MSQKTHVFAGQHIELVDLSVHKASSKYVAEITLKVEGVGTQGRGEHANPIAATLAAIQSVVKYEVQLLNYTISAGTKDPNGKVEDAQVDAWISVADKDMRTVIEFASHQDMCSALALAYIRALYMLVRD